MIRRVAYLAMHSSPLLDPGSGDAGGMNVYVHELACTMAGRGVEVVVFTRRADPDSPDEVAVEEGYRVIHLDAGPPSPLPIPRLHPLVGRFGEGVVKWAQRNRISFDIVHSHYWLAGWAGVLAKEALDVPLANSFHTLGRVKDLLRRVDESPESTTRLLTEEEVLAQADCVVAATPYEFDDLLEHYGASPERLCISPPGIDRDMYFPGDRAAARSALALDDERILLFVGRIQAHKGVDVAIRALAGLPDQPSEGRPRPRLLIVGGPSGPDGESELASVRTLAADLGVSDRVDFLGPQPHATLGDYYRAADTLVMPSRSESFGLVAAEAQACGLPVVATRVGGLAYVVSDSESGLLVEGADPAAFAAAVSAVIDHPDFSARLSAGATRFARRFSWPGTAERLLELYEGISTR